jgi:hypothetical protein
VEKADVDTGVLRDSLTLKTRKNAGEQWVGWKECCSFSAAQWSLHHRARDKELRIPKVGARKRDYWSVYEITGSSRTLNKYLLDE